MRQRHAKTNLDTSDTGPSTAPTSDLKTIAGLNGYTVTRLARAVKRSRQTVYRAWSNPRRFPKAYAHMNQLLRVRTVTYASN